MEYKNNQQIRGTSNATPRIDPHQVRTHLSRDVASILRGNNYDTNNRGIHFNESASVIGLRQSKAPVTHTVTRPTRGNFIPISHFAPLMRRAV